MTEVLPEPAPCDMAALAVVLPAYNEEKHVAEVVEAALRVGVGHVVCVNDCSVDSTGAIIDRLTADPRVEALHHPVNLGKQGAVKTGLQAVLRHADAAVIGVLDADMQNDPALLPGMCPHCGPFDVVMGVRTQGHMPAVRRVANALANMPYRVIAGVQVHDVQSGYRLYTRSVACCLAEHLSTVGRYTLEHTTMLLFGRLACEWGRDFRVAEVPIPFTYVGARSSIRMWDNVQLARAALRHARALARLQR